jgi:hypothetical protein
MAFGLFCQGCSSDDRPAAADASSEPIAPEGSFGEAVEFLMQHTNVVVLDDGTGGQVAVLPELQGRVMTSTLAGREGTSMGWINRELIASGETLEHMNPYGGEDRFWMGPEGGQFSIFFRPGDPFDLEHWFTPAAFDTEPFELIESSSRRVIFTKAMRLENYSGTEFDLRVDREVRLLDRTAAARILGVQPDPAVPMVAFESENTITNTGAHAWTTDGGLLSIWILGMFNPSPATTVVVPFQKSTDVELGAVVNDAYFGKVPAERLKRGDGVLYFSGDGQYRSKIGLKPARAKSLLGSYDAINGILTIVHYTKPAGVTRYVNSMWEIQDAPFGGDVVNSYNDGPPEPGAKPLGPFYELETSSPAAALAPGAKMTHVHSTFHFKGTETELNAIARSTLGATIEEIISAL